MCTVNGWAEEVGSLGPGRQEGRSRERWVPPSLEEERAISDIRTGPGVAEGKLGMHSHFETNWCIWYVCVGVQGGCLSVDSF